ncbi:hypothetical protein LUZ60_013040 [Juncus effusus]|nr:hypothetical protein LUZ60_013040 [Juncus effusus]
MALRRGSASVYSLLLHRTPAKSQLVSAFYQDFQSSHNFNSFRQYYSPINPTSLLKLPNFPSIYSLTQTRPASKISIGPKQTESKSEPDSDLIYQGPISSTIKKVKLLSLSTCCLSISLGPVITFMTSPDMNVILKGAVASTVIFLSASTTAALQWFVSPYIHKLRWRPGSDSFEAEMMSWLATPLKKTVKFADIRKAETSRPYVSFRAGGDFYFVDAEHFSNKAVLARLTPDKSENQSAFKNL